MLPAEEFFWIKKHGELFLFNLTGIQRKRKKIGRWFWIFLASDWKDVWIYRLIWGNFTIWLRQFCGNLCSFSEKLIFWFRWKSATCKIMPFWNYRSINRFFFCSFLSFIFFSHPHKVTAWKKSSFCDSYCAAVFCESGDGGFFSGFASSEVWDGLIYCAMWSVVKFLWEF